MRKLLWIGDAACPSGFARATHYTLEELRKTWEVYVLGLNYRGDPHTYPYKIYPAHTGGDGFGVGRTTELVQQIRPDVVVIQNDPWNVPLYTDYLRNVPTVATLAVDGEHMKDARRLNVLHLAMFWTQFGADQALKNGFTGQYAICPLGVDLDIYKPMDQAEARKKFFAEEDYPRLKDAFIVMNVNRNQPRKRLDLTVSYFANWVREYNVEDAYLALHIGPTGDVGYDVQDLMRYYGLANRLILSSPEVYKGVSETTLANNYNCADVGFTTTQGEGWGLTTMEMMACRVPQIAPNWSALGEWPEDSIVKVPVSEIAVTFGNVNVFGAIMDRKEGVAALDKMYRDRYHRMDYAERGLKKVQEAQYRWSAIGQRFAAALEESFRCIGVRVGR